MAVAMYQGNFDEDDVLASWMQKHQSVHSSWLQKGDNKNEVLMRLTIKENGKISLTASQEKWLIETINQSKQSSPTKKRSCFCCFKRG